MRSRQKDMTARDEMLREVAVEHRRPTVDGVSTSLLESGEGPAMILLHGGIECGGVYWAPVIPRLAKTHRLIVPDVPGIGESDPLRRLDTDSFNRWFGSLLRTTGTHQPILVAHSLLGSLAGRFAAQHSDLLQGLVVYGGLGIGRYRLPIGLQLAAIRFGLWPTERNAERFDRWALHDLDGFRRRQCLLPLPGLGSACKADNARASPCRVATDSRCSPRPDQLPDGAGVGPVRPDGVPVARSGRQRKARLAAIGDRQCWPRTPHGAAGGVRPRTGWHRVGSNHARPVVRSHQPRPASGILRR
jgi:pimeloyl-ACP methyl ester carboxylesterase